MSNPSDPITTEVIRNAFNATADDMSRVLGRSAFSPVIYECKNYGVGLFNEKVETLGQAPGHPLFIGGLDWGVQSVVDKYGLENLNPGDVFVVNDSYITGMHLNDTDIIRVLTYKDEPIGFAGIRAHWADVGTADPGYPVDTTEIFQEGLRLGPTRIVEKGQFVRDIVDILCMNSREPKSIDFTDDLVNRIEFVETFVISELLRNLGCHRASPPSSPRASRDRCTLIFEAVL